MRCLVSTLFILWMSASFAQQTVGLFTQTTGSTDGYVLFAPTRSDSTYLIDKCGKRIHQWSSSYNPGLSVYLLPNGNLLRSGFIQNPYFAAPGGIIELYNWDDSLLWSYQILDSLETQNHDIYPMPNGNILVVIWEKYTPTEAIDAGRNPAFVGTELWSAKIQEIEPVGSNTANIVWEWRLWDHLVQHFNASKSNYGVIADHPELLNINYMAGNPGAIDWIHLNAVSYNEQLDQIVICSHSLSEIYIIDHSTTTAEAASHSGGNSGKGGDFLYRWGNPAAYNLGTANDQKLFLPHSPYWIPAGYPGENKIMIFNNGVNRPGGSASSVDVIAPPVDASGNYIITPGMAFGPATTDWSYSAPTPSNFYSNIMGGAQRLPNGNTLVCESTQGNFFELDTLSNIVWRYVNPVNNSGPLQQGTTPSGINSYRSIWYPVNYSGFAGHTMTPGEPIELNPLPYNCIMNTATGLSTATTQTGDFVVENPFGTTIHIFSASTAGRLNLNLYSAKGELIVQWKNISVLENSSINLSLPHQLSGGIYFLTYSGNNLNGSIKLIKTSE
ncbi:MAG TPA: aryl-sulfate sulfotransferase [Bacteroidia bacterium]|nr:aryl-sulfate sulfotransferase [Bacteroidia bacterium]